MPVVKCWRRTCSTTWGSAGRWLPRDRTQPFHRTDEARIQALAARQPQAVAIARTTRIDLAGHEHDVLLQRSLEQLARVHARQFQPQQESALWFGGAGACREMLGYQLAQPSHLFAVQAAHAMQMVLVAACFQIRGHRIAEQLRLAAGGLELQQRDALCEATAIQPADAVIRRQCL